MQMHSLKDLFQHELQDIYSAEQQILKALPKMAKAAGSEELRDALNEHLTITEQQVERLDRIFESCGVTPGGKKCKGMAGLIEEGNELLKEDMDDAVLDAALISAAQRVEHYEMAAYGTVCSYAKLLGDDESAELLQQTLDEEAEADRKLSELAETGVNLRAANGDMETEADDAEEDEEEEEEEEEHEKPPSAKKR